jgi:hypothetical protein
VVWLGYRQSHEWLTGSGRGRSRGSGCGAMETDDDDITTSDTTIPSIELRGPIMRSRAQQLCR